MTDAPPAASAARSERANTRLYAGVIAVEALVLLGIWLFQRYFGT